jgi:hypothetical protein
MKTSRPTCLWVILCGRVTWGGAYRLPTLHDVFTTLAKRSVPDTFSEFQVASCWRGPVGFVGTFETRFKGPSGTLGKATSELEFSGSEECISVGTSRDFPVPAFGAYEVEVWYDGEMQARTAWEVTPEILAIRGE